MTFCALLVGPRRCLHQLATSNLKLIPVSDTADTSNTPEKSIRRNIKPTSQTNNSHSSTYQPHSKRELNQIWGLIAALRWKVASTWTDFYRSQLLLQISNDSNSIQRSDLLDLLAQDQVWGTGKRSQASSYVNRSSKFRARLNCFPFEPVGYIPGEDTISTPSTRILIRLSTYLLA